MRTLYPAIEPYNSDELKVSALHTVYYEESGSSPGLPVLFIHGGPGGGTIPEYRRFFDPNKYRIILFDQRGCGRSTPHAVLEENTTWELVADIEKLRQHLGIQQWLVFGGSWGSTLGLTYAEQHPSAVLGLILRGIFLCRRTEINWFYQQGANALFPESWEVFAAEIPQEERSDMLGAYYRRLTSEDESLQVRAAKPWSVWEASTSKLRPDQTLIDHFSEPQVALSLARIECHYFMNDCFFPTENYLLENAERLRNIPGVIIQGRYDVVCPMMSAWDLHLAWPGAELRVIPDAGHSALEPGIVDALVAATDAFRPL